MIKIGEVSNYKLFRKMFLKYNVILINKRHW